LNQVCQDIKNQEKQEPLNLILPNNLSKEITIILVHAHLKNLMDPTKGFRQHAKEALEKNNLPPLDLGDSDSWGILKIIPPPSKPTSPSSHVRALDNQVNQIMEDTTQAVQTNREETSFQPAETPAKPIEDQQTHEQNKETRNTQPSVRPKQKQQQTQTHPKDRSRSTSRCKYKKDKEKKRPGSDNEQQTTPQSHPKPNSPERLMDGTAREASFYGVRLYTPNPQNFDHQDTTKIGLEIAKGNMKWLYTNTNYGDMVTANNIHKHLIAGEMNLTHTPILKYTNINELQNGFYSKDKHHKP